MRVTHRQTVHDDPERQARLEAHRQRIQARLTAERTKVAEIKKQTQPRVSYLKRLLRKIDRINAMGSKWGWSL